MWTSAIAGYLLLCGVCRLVDLRAPGRVSYVLRGSAHVAGPQHSNRDRARAALLVCGSRRGMSRPLLPSPLLSFSLSLRKGIMPTAESGSPPAPPAKPDKDGLPGHALSGQWANVCISNLRRLITQQIPRFSRRPYIADTRALAAALDSGLEDELEGDFCVKLIERRAHAMTSHAPPCPHARECALVQVGRSASTPPLCRHSFTRGSSPSPVRRATIEHGWAGASAT